MDKHSNYKGEAVLVIEQILNSPFMQELDIRTAFFAFDHIYVRIVAQMIVANKLDKEAYLKAFAKTLSEAIDDITAPKIP